LRQALDDLGLGPTTTGRTCSTTGPTSPSGTALPPPATPSGTTCSPATAPASTTPCPRAWRQLAAHYPDAKVVLSVRDPGRWWDSMDKDRRDGRAAGDRVLLAVEDEGFGPEPIRFREQPARVAVGGACAWSTGSRIRGVRVGCQAAPSCGWSDGCRV